MMFVHDFFTHVRKFEPVPRFSFFTRSNVVTVPLALLEREWQYCEQGCLKFGNDRWILQESENRKTGGLCGKLLVVSLLVGCLCRQSCE